MIELRVVDNGLGSYPDFQYRFMLFTADASGALCPPNSNDVWSRWKTADWVKAEDIKDA